MGYCCCVPNSVLYLSIICMITHMIAIHVGYVSIHSAPLDGVAGDVVTVISVETKSVMIHSSHVHIIINMKCTERGRYVSAHPSFQVEHLLECQDANVIGWCCLNSGSASLQDPGYCRRKP
jgi:hypothetical protein